MTEETQPDKGKLEITVLVRAPRTPHPKKFTWRIDMLVGTAADQAAKEFGYEGGTPSFQNKEGRVLDRQKTLHQEGVRDHDVLELVDTGGGV